jgi:hypothetical protein
MAGCCQHARFYGFCNKILASANRGRYFFGRRTAVASDFGNDQSTVLMQQNTNPGRKKQNLKKKKKEEAASLSISQQDKYRC